MYPTSRDEYIKCRYIPYLEGKTLNKLLSCLVDEKYSLRIDQVHLACISNKIQQPIAVYVECIECIYVK